MTKNQKCWKKDFCQKFTFRADNVWGDVGDFKNVSAFSANRRPIFNPTLIISGALGLLALFFELELFPPILSELAFEGSSSEESDSPINEILCFH